MNKKQTILDTVEFPSDIKHFSDKQLTELCGDIRKFLIQTVSKTGGHFGSNLGVVELTVALHKVFNTPTDKLIWDVGHQSYPHKILTGRKNRLHTIRQKDGLAPFPKPSESEYDTFSVGHSSTSISAAVGMAIANRDRKNAPQVVVIIGDGALTGGMAIEALNHAGDARANVLVILNDNKMSISPNVGGMSNYLTRLISSPAYLRLRKKGKRTLKATPKIYDLVKRLKISTKSIIMPGTLFEELGFGYYGPIDGHDVATLVRVLENLKTVKGPKLLHIVTEKGKGYHPAEQDQTSFHAVTPFDLQTGQKNEQGPSKLTYTKVFSDWICAKAALDSNLHAITPAMCTGSGLLEFSKQFPTRYHDVGIAEQHAVTFAAGLATAGQKPVVAIYSSFLQRAYDQLIHDVALDDLDVLFAIDRAGIVGADGATHNGSFDMSFLRSIPNLVIAAPADETECRALLDACYDYNGPAAVRYPRGGTLGKYSDQNPTIQIGKAQVVRHGQKVAILVFGAMLNACQPIADELNATLVNMRFAKPIDQELLSELAKTHDYFITVEDNAITGGAGSAVNEFVLNNQLDVKIKNLGLPDTFMPHGSRDQILAEAGLDEQSILKSIKSFIK